MIFLLLFSFLIFLFSLYVLSHEDFVLLRKNIHMDQLFNLAFLTGFIGLFSARIVYVAFHFSPNYLNPLVFFVFPYFPGLSLTGGIIGGAVFVLLYTARHKIPTRRVLDYFAFSLIWALTVGSAIDITAQIIARKKITTLVFSEPALYGIMGVSFLAFLLSRQRKAELKDGTVSLLFLLYFSVLTFIGDIFARRGTGLFYIGKEDVVLIVLFFVSIVLLVRNEQLFGKYTRLRKQPEKNT